MLLQELAVNLCRLVLGYFYKYRAVRAIDLGIWLSTYVRLMIFDFFA
jgi:hypothetical protein